VGRVMRIAARPLTAAAFAPFGTVTDAGDQAEVGPIVNGRIGVGPRPRWSLAGVTTLPHRATVMERHRFSSQCFIPCDVGARWLVLVMPHSADGGPDPAGALAFVADGGQALTYAPDIWHHPLTAIGAALRFAVLTHLDGGAEDTEFVALSGVVEVDGA